MSELLVDRVRFSGGEKLLWLAELGEVDRSFMANLAETAAARDLTDAVPNSDTNIDSESGLEGAEDSVSWNTLWNESKTWSPCCRRTAIVVLEPRSSPSHFRRSSPRFLETQFLAGSKLQR